MLRPITSQIGLLKITSELEIFAAGASSWQCVLRVVLLALEYWRLDVQVFWILDDPSDSSSWNTFPVSYKSQKAFWTLLKIWLSKLCKANAFPCHSTSQPWLYLIKADLLEVSDVFGSCCITIYEKTTWAKTWTFPPFIYNMVHCHIWGHLQLAAR